MRLFFFIFILFFINCEVKNGSHHNDDIQYPKECDLNELFYTRDTLNKYGVLNDSIWMALANKVLNQECHYEYDSVLIEFANNFHNLGARFFLTQTQQSRIFHQAALKLRKDFFKDSVHLDVLRSLINIGSTYVLEENYLEALKYFDSADVIDKQFEVFPYIYTKIRKGFAYMNMHEFDNSLHCLNEALNRVVDIASDTILNNSEAWAKSSRYIYDLMATRCDLYIAMKQFSKAIQSAEYGINLVRKFGPSSDSLNQLGYLYNSIGNAFQDSLKMVKFPDHHERLDIYAESFYSKAREYFDSSGNDQALMTCIGNLAALYERMGKYKHSQLINEEGIELYKSLNDPLLKNQLKIFYINHGTALARQNLFQEAMNSYSSALHIISNSRPLNKDLPRINEFYKDCESSLVLLASIGRVQLQLAKGDTKFVVQANASYDSLAHLINFIRANLINDYSKIRLAEKSRQWLPDAFQDIKELYTLTGDQLYIDRAFQLVEQAKAFSLIEASRLNNAKDQLPIALQSKKEELLSFQQKALHNDSIAGLVEKKQREFISELKLKVPSYFAIKYKGVDISIQDIQQNLLEEDQAMLEYFIQDSLINIFLISKSHFIFDTVGILKTELEKLISSFRKSINPVNQEGITDPKLVREFCLTSNQLYEILIGHIKIKYGLPERLIIIPDGILNNLSFDALLYKLSNDGNNLPLQAKDGNYLIQQHAISYCFSASMLQEMSRALRQNNLKTSLAIIAPQFHSESKDLPYLTYQSDEIAGIKSVYDNTYTDNQNTKEQFIRATEKYAYLHISTHGFVADDPDQSFISFSQFSPKPDSNQFLFLKELYNYPMNQELITLTACETALGQLKEGEGNISLARGFAYSGVKSFITTLWKINTHGASNIIPGFYHHFFNQAQPKDVALATSKREFLAAGKSVYPENWAGLILIGSSKRAIQSSDPAYWEICICALILTLGWIFYMQRKKQLSA